ncbi:MAG: N-acetyltransferase [Kofleriaceae bacterium]|nr:N-acetyltransferase [Kofleriaceae bacterium]
MASSTISVRAVPSISEVSPAAWDGLEHGPSPFLRHGFLKALEDSGSVGGTGRKRSGWVPVYLLAELGSQLVGAVAAYVKEHSYGEYIFDWGWANAAQRAGIRYYPKLVVAAPATPATGNRLLLAKDAPPVVTEALLAAVRQVADDTDCSSIHWLFCTAAEQRMLAEHGYFARDTLQFHWKNRGYTSFDGFLGELKSRKRKQIRKERAKAQAAIERLTWVEGRELDQARLDDLDRFYRNTTDNHGGRDYLRPGFFHRLAETLPESMRMVEVIAGGQRIAGALFFETPEGLYGRYWGADAHVDMLHFETAYYAGIDRAIEKRIPLFEAGAQGEHKLLRGFEPSPTYSAHWIRHPGLAAAIQDYTARESAAMATELAEMAKYGPYRSDNDDE